MLKRITYVSRFAKPFSEAELEKLGEVSSKNNRKLDITGVLMTSGGIFFQILEGPEEAVDQVYAAISADSRHTDLVVLELELDISVRNYPDWSMKTINLDASSHVRLLPLKVMMETVFEQQLLIDKMLWAIDRTLKHELRES
jgi:adenylate cyclase